MHETDEAMTEDEVAAAEKERTAARLQLFGANLAKQRDEWVRARRATGVEKRWGEDVDQYHGRDAASKGVAQMMDAVEQGFPVTAQGTSPKRSTVFIGLTRQKTNSAAARLADIVLPTDDRNFGVMPSPKPELAMQLRDEEPVIDPRTNQPAAFADGTPIKKKDLARRIHELARQGALGMQDTIDDQLNECDYNGELRKVLHDAACLGTGVIKGPIVTNRTRKAWVKRQDASGAVYEMKIVDDKKPASYRVDPRNVYPDPGCGESVHNGSGVFEFDSLSEKQVRDLAKQNGYSRDQLIKVIREGPQKSAREEQTRDQRDPDQIDLDDKRFGMWTYWGALDREDLACAGVDVGELDELDSISGCVVMINSTVVKAYLNPLEDGALPYDFYPWEKVTGSVWGYGIPYLMRSQQRVLNAAWRMMMDNAAASSGPQIVINSEAIHPADKQWTLYGRKIWLSKDPTIDVSKAFSLFQVDSRQAELAAIIEMAMKLVDDETGVPQITQGEQGNAPDTVGGMQMLMNAANVVLRRLVKQFDDFITRPHIRRYYDYNMLFSDDDAIKGDFAVDARGSSALIVRDIQNQAYTQLLQAAANPVFAPYIDPKKLFEAALKAQKIDPAEIFKADEEIDQILEAAKQGGQPDPRVQAAQIKAEAEISKAKSQSQADQVEMQSRVQMAKQDHDYRMAQLTLEREIAILKLAADKDLKIEDIKARLADTAIKERGKKELFAAEAHLRTTTGQGI